MEKITLQKFLGLQGASRFIQIASKPLFKEGTVKTYDEWYNVISKHFKIGDRKTFPTPVAAQAQEKQTDNKIQTKK